MGKKHRNRHEDNPDILPDRFLSLERFHKSVSGEEISPIITGHNPQFRIPAGTLAEMFKKMAEEVNAQVTIVEDIRELVPAISALISGNGWETVVCKENQVRNLFASSDITFKMSESLSDETDVIITGCENLISSLGSVLVSSGQAGSRKMFVYPPAHIVVARESQLTETLEEAYEQTIARYGNDLPSLITVITGPSRTADIEKTLILGAHGPKKLHIFIVRKDFYSK